MKGTKEIKKTIKSILICLIIALLFLSLFRTKDNIKLSKESFNMKAMNTVQHMEDLNYYKDDFWEWNTRTTTNDMAYNGRHIDIINNDPKKAIDFYGYGERSYKDYLYKAYPYPGEKIFRFKLEEVRTDYHTLEGAGFLFNAKKENGKLTADVILLGKDKINLYRLEEVYDYTFQNTPNKHITDYISATLASVNKPQASVHQMEIKTSPSNITVIDNEQEILNVDLDYTNHAGDDFGLIVSYGEHSCSSLSKIEFSEFTLEVKDYNLPLKVKNDIDMKIEGATFELLDSEENVISEGISDENGMWELIGLKPGEYKIRQKTTIAGHRIYSEDYPFIITGDGKAYKGDSEEEIEEITIINERILADIDILLEDDIEEEIQGGTFQLIDEEGNVIKSGSTDKDGLLKIKDITPGKYTLKQKSTIEGYEISTEVYTFTVTEEGKVVDSKTSKEIELINVLNKRIIEEDETGKNEIQQNEIDDGKAEGVLPQTGEQIILVSMIMISFISIIVFYYKYRNIDN